MAENDSQEVTIKQETFIAALIAGHTIQTAAKAARIGERTAYRWLKFPHIQSAYKAAQKEAFNDSLDELRLGVKDVIKALKRHVDADVEPTASTQMQAIKTWIEQAVSLHKTAELEEKINELEQVLSQQGKDR